MNNGKFVISLDFELFWGVRDVRSIKSYGDNILGVYAAIPKLLELFEEYGITATFSTVGFLFFENKTVLLQNLPASIPQYDDQRLSPYAAINSIGDDLTTDKYYFAPELIKLIQKYPAQEIGTHTFSHYYCLEKGQTTDNFIADITAAKKVAMSYGITIESLVFPRNQFNGDYLEAGKNLGILCIRGNERSWLYEARGRDKESLVRRAIRLADAYINISGHNCYTDEELRIDGLTNIPASRFLRPFSKKLALLDSLKLKRIKKGMTIAAKNNMTYHLWWHPHNFGIDQKENFIFLEKILMHYQQLNKAYGFQSYTMSGLSKLVNPK
ncbi:MAG TPA: polysaccharide deacetylase family protein [Ferruginibacter sp.]|nr:polysaccharide deacetylase family protein [Ferruginibacter sp.]